MQDDVLPETHILARHTRTGNEKKLRVIGVLNPGSFFSGGVIASYDTLNELAGEAVPPRGHLFRLNGDADPEASAKALEAQFLEHGMQAKSVAEEVRREAASERVFNLLLEGFMGLGLVVGIAALGMIAARSVVEHRHQIGVLRALGFQKGMVQLSFLLESSFIALLGVALGVVLGMILSYNIIQEVAKTQEGLVYEIPWVNIAVVIVVAYVASLLTTYLPARPPGRKGLPRRSPPLRVGTGTQLSEVDFVSHSPNDKRATGLCRPLSQHDRVKVFTVKLADDADGVLPCSKFPFAAGS